MSIENIVIAIVLLASPLVIASAYWRSSSTSDAFCDKCFHLFEYLSSVNSSFIFCGDFNIHVDTNSNESVKFQNGLESCNTNQHIHTLTSHTFLMSSSLMMIQVLFQMFGLVSSSMTALLQDLLNFFIYIFISLKKIYNQVQNTGTVFKVYVFM